MCPHYTNPCLPLSFRNDFKILQLVFKGLNGQAPAYIFDLLTPYEPDGRLRSSSRALLTVPKSRSVTKGDQAFAVRAPRLWNSLPLLNLLKTHFYHMAFS